MGCHFLLQCMKVKSESEVTQSPANLENSAVATGLEKVSFHSNPKERQCQRCSNYHTIALISHTSIVMLKFLQARLQQYVNREIPDVQAGFRKGRGTRPGDLPNPGIEPRSPALRADALPSELPRKPQINYTPIKKNFFMENFEHYFTSV